MIWFLYLTSIKNNIYSDKEHAALQMDYRAIILARTGSRNIKAFILVIYTILRLFFLIFTEHYFAIKLSQYKLLSYH